MKRVFRPAVITPFHRNDVQKLARCHSSVLRQTLSAHHILVGDGVSIAQSMFPDAEIIALGANHSDNGNTPRALGALVAASRGFFPIFFLDVDNWYRDDHIQVAIETANQFPDVDIVISRRSVVLDDGYELGMVPEDDRKDFADTSCYCFFPSTYNLLHCWALMPKVLSPICDRVMFRTLQAQSVKFAWTGLPTCFFESHYSSHYYLAKRAPRQRLHDPDWKAIEANMSILIEDYFMATGIRISPPL